VGHHTEAFVGIDTSKLRNAVAIADGGRGGEVRYLGEFPATEAAIQKLVAKLAAKYRHLTFCYEAGPTGYGLYRLLKSLSHECLVVAPSLIPKKAGDRVKTNRRDAVSLAKLLRAGELTAVWVPDERHEAMRDLSRARQAVKKDLQGKRQQISSLMLRLGRIYPGKTTWGPAHMRWLTSQKLEHREQRIAFEELLEGMRQESERVERLEKAIREAVPEWSLAEVVAALQAMRGIDLIAAVGVLAEIGDLSRFQNPRELMGFPSRNYRPKLSPDESRWAQGLAAWDLLYTDTSGRLLDKVNAWLSGEERLRTGYRLENFNSRKCQFRAGFTSCSSAVLPRTTSANCKKFMQRSVADRRLLCAILRGASELHQAMSASEYLR
jgi:transposase